MKVAIIGGGFYGIMASLKAATTNHVKEVHLFEKGRSLLHAAGKYNQARLHLGFHYPRSQETIEQSKSGAKIYEKRFPSVVKKIKKNIYIIRDDGHISIDEYLYTMKQNKLKYREIDLSGSSFNYKAGGQDFKAIQVDEKYIDVSMLDYVLLQEIKNSGIHVHLNKEVKFVDTNLGNLELDNGKSDDFDFIVNCTYTDPFNGFSSQIPDLKFEYCSMLLIAAQGISGQAITIMDGNFASVYPWLSNLHSVSSVKFTPHIKADSFADLNKLVAELSREDYNKASNLIEDHMCELLEFEYTLVSDFSTVKVKLKEDKDDQRLVKTFFEGKCMSVLQGKLDAVNYFLDDFVLKLEKFK